MNIKDNSILNIFTDGSILKKVSTGETIGCPGALIMSYESDKFKVINKAHLIVRNSTNNDTEIRSILLGIDLAINYINKNNNVKKINLFSDSKICIFGLREWIFKWINCVDNYILFSSSGNPVANQEIVKHIIQKIVYYNLPITFFHQKGHVSSKSKNSLDNALRVFNISNKCNIKNIEFIKMISEFNNEVDTFTKSYLREYDTMINMFEKRSDKEINPFTRSLENINMSKYKNLIKG